MTKVFQTIFEKGYGNCMQAVIASLLDKQLCDIPNFKESENPNMHMFIYLTKLGYDPSYFESSHGKINLFDILDFDSGIDGYFMAVVQSQTHIDDQNIKHAVIVDKHLNIIHDPNPNQLAMKLKSTDIIRVLTLGTWSIQNGQFIK